MPKEKSYEMKTVIVDGDVNSFKAALSRSLMGVTFVKFNRSKKRKLFYQNQVYNRTVTRSLFNTLHEYLVNSQINFSQFKLKTQLTPNYEDGKIKSVKDVNVSIYMKVGELKIDELKVHEEFKNVKIDLFYNETDLASSKLREEMPKTLKEMGFNPSDYSEYNEHDFSSIEGKELAEAYGVKGTPTIVVNAGEQKLELPDLKKLKQQLEDALSPMVTPTTKPEFNRDPNLENNIASLAEIVNKVPKMWAR